MTTPFDFDLQLFGGSSSTTNVSSYTPTEYELQLQDAQAKYANAVSPNALYLNDTARQLLQDSLGTVQVNYNGLNSNAQEQLGALQDYYRALQIGNTNLANNTNQALSGYIDDYGAIGDSAMDAADVANAALAGYISDNTAQKGKTNSFLDKTIGLNTAATNSTNSRLGDYINQGTGATNRANADLAEYIRNNKGALSTVDDSITGLESGVLPSAYQANMENAIRSALQRTVGNNVNNLAQRGVINSSVTNSALNDIERNAADAVAQQYLQNINTLGNLAQQKFSDYITADQQNAAMTQQQLGNTNANIDRGVNITQQQYTNTMGNNATNASLAQQQLDNTLNTNNANANMTQSQYGNTMNSLNTKASMVGQQAGLTQQQFSNSANMNAQNANLAGQWGNMITSPVTTAAASQEAAQSPATNLWNASLGLNGASTGALAAAAGKGTTTSTTTQSGGGGFLGGLLSAGVTAFCFPAGTQVQMADGNTKPIEEIIPGDKVKGTDSEEEVVRTSQPHKQKIYAIETADGKTTRSSTTQPFMDVKGEWILMRDIHVGTVLDGAGTVIRKAPLDVQTVYDFETTNENVYIVDGGFVAMGGSREIWGE